GTMNQQHERLRGNVRRWEEYSSSMSGIPRRLKRWSVARLRVAAQGLAATSARHATSRCLDVRGRVCSYCSLCSPSER
ncbi:MAG: hypothetical protein ACK53L_19065, partial [Pirellulaceae bacterium]